MCKAVTKVRRGLDEGGAGRVLTVGVAWTCKLVPTWGKEVRLIN